jgi:hypothetical protein
MQLWLEHSLAAMGIFVHAYLCRLLQVPRMPALTAPFISLGGQGIDIAIPTQTFSIANSFTSCVLKSQVAVKKSWLPGGRLI